jgi:hypothetical protein
LSEGNKFARCRFEARQALVIKERVAVLFSGAMQGDTAVASALFQQYLARELPEELLALSRRCVQEDQKGRPVREINGARPPAGSLTPAAGEFADFGGALKGQVM